MRRRRNQYREKKSRVQRRAGRLDFNRRRKREVNTARLREVITWSLEIMLTVAVAAVIVFFLGVRVSVVGSSMEETLYNGDTVLVNRFVYKLFSPKANDIVVFLPNGNAKSHYYVKRVIAGPGDTVQIMDGKVYVNGEPFQEEIENPTIANGLLAEEPVLVKEDEYFVLGDNRDNSEDSRYANIGNVKKEHILGKAWFIVSPWKKFGFLK